MVLFCDRHGLWPSLLWPSLSTLWPSWSWFVAVMVCGRHGHGLWPSLLWPSWSWFVAVMVCGHRCCGRHGLWPSWYRLEWTPQGHIGRVSLVYSLKGAARNFSRNRSGVWILSGTRCTNYVIPSARYIEIYNGIVRFPCGSTAFLLAENGVFFLPLSYLAPPLPMFPLEFRGEVNHEETRVMGLLSRDRQTDRRTGDSIYAL